MTVTRRQIRRWIARASDGDQYMIVHRDSFSNEYWPDFAETREDAKEQIECAREDSMHSIKEIYDLSMDIEEQVESSHVWNL